MRTLGRRLEATSTSILDVLFPPVCAGCGRRGHWVCGECRTTVPPLTDLGCIRCGARSPSDCVCGQIPDALVAIRSAFPFDGWVRTAIHSFKYEGERARARHLGDLLGPLLPVAFRIDAVVPIPLHPARMRQRGFNQATLLADRLARWVDDVPIIEIERHGSTTPQVELTAAERVANVAGAFVVDSAQLDDLNVALVDDVVTTTSTMVACARALVDAGAASVVGVSVARAV